MMESHNNTIVQISSNFPMNASQKKESKLRRRRRRSIIREFALNTSTNGIPGIARSESIQNRLFWIIAFLIFAGMMMYFIIETILAYFQYPTQTTIDVSSKRLQYFPAFTFCNAGGIRYDVLLQAYLNYTDATNVTNLDDVNVSASSMLTFMMMYLPMLINDGQSLGLYVFSLESMLISCTYAGNVCSPNDFTSFYSASYGRCYTFNAKTKNKNLYYSYSNSGQGVLALRLYLHSQIYVSYVTEGIAIIGMVHDNTQLPSIERAGMALAPGFKHRLTYSKTTVYSLPPPYSTCTEKIPLAMKYMFEKYGGADYAYSEDICYIICEQAYVYKQCGCVVPTQWNARSIAVPGTDTVITVPLCNGSDPCFSKAVSDFELTPSIVDESCAYCSQQCSITTFSVKPSFYTAPPDWLMNTIKTFVENSSIPLPVNWTTQWHDYIKASYVSVEVIGESTLVENYTATATLGFIDVISNIGGQTGLWIGISFLSLMEFVEMIYRLVRYHIYLVGRTKKETNDLRPEQ